MSAQIRSVRLQFKICRQLNKWVQLNCLAMPWAKGSRVVHGVLRDGRAFMIYAKKSQIKTMNPKIAATMREYELRGGVAGVAYNILDAWDIVFNDEKEYKRKKRTYLHRKSFSKGAKRDDSEE